MAREVACWGVVAGGVGVLAVWAVASLAMGGGEGAVGEAGGGVVVAGVGRCWLLAVGLPAQRLVVWAEAAALMQGVAVMAWPVVEAAVWVAAWGRVAGVPAGVLAGTVAAGSVLGLMGNLV
jgi:hypothetical protein